MNPLIAIGVGIFLGIVISFGDSRRVQGTHRGPLVGVLMALAFISASLVFYFNAQAGLTPLETAGYIVVSGMAVLLLKEGI